MAEEYVIVAFRYDQKRSVVYKGSNCMRTIADEVYNALANLKVDVISIRRVYEKCPAET